MHIRNLLRAPMTVASVLQVKKLVPEAQIPTRGSVDAAGFDLYAAVDTVIPKGGKGIVKTGLSIACPSGTYGRVAPRSGLAVKKFIDVGAGVIDADYRGEVGVVLFNFGEEDFVVTKGDRVAQLVLEQVCMAPAVEVQELSETERGAGGFGSTGVSEDVPVGQKRPISPSTSSISVADLLSLIESDDIPSELRTSLKILALKQDEGLVAAVSVYSKSGNKDSLLETLRMLV